MASKHLMQLVTLTLTVLVSGGYCCMCQPRHPQQHFCDAAFVIQAGILDKDLVYDGDRHIANHFIVNIKKVYKASEEYENATTFFVSSPAETHTACGIRDPVRGQDYLITGFISDGELQTTSCDWIVPHDQLTAAQKNGLNSKYALGCQNCNMVICREGQCGEKKPETCTWDFFGQTADCYIQHGICRQDGSECDWVNTSAFQECEENVLFGGNVHRDGLL